MLDTTPQHAPSASHSSGFARPTRAGVAASVLLVAAVPVVALAATYPVVATFTAALLVVVALYRSAPADRTVPLTVSGLGDD